MRRLHFVALALSLAAAATVYAATTQTWELNGYGDFVKGRMSGLTLSRDGKLSVGPHFDAWFDSAQAQIWSVATAPDGSVYAGTGTRGRLYRVDANGQGTLVWSSNEPMIFALAVDTRGVLYAGTSPDGKIYRIENGRATEYFAPGSRYIWSLAFGPDGALYAGTGDQGRVYRITAQGQGSVYYDTAQANVTALAFDTQGALLAGTDPNGIVYRISGPGKAFVLYDSNLPEIRALLPASDGSVYAAALGGGTARQGNAAAAASGSTSAGNLPVVSTSITVTDQQEALVALPKPEATRAATSQALTTTSTATVDYAGVDKSALYKINADNTVETLWTSKDESLYDIALDGSNVLLYTDQMGRVYRLEPDRKTTLLGQTGEGDSTRLVKASAGWLAASGSVGKLFRIGATPAGGGWFESPVHDSNTVARWGRLSSRGSGATFKTRTGNTARPDATWSDWAETAQGLISSPNARYIQWRGELGGSAPGAASVEDVTVAYLPQNTAPVVRSVTVTNAATPASTPSSKSSSGAATAAYSITVTDTGDSSSAVGTTSQTISRGGGQQLQITWQADDPDGDRLLYSLYFRGDEETRWKLLRGNTIDNTYTIESDVLADGRYYFRVVASDRLSNPSDTAREAEGISAPVWIDSTPPVVTLSAPRRSGDGSASVVEIDIDAEDRASALKRCEFSVDAGPWTPVEASDGVTDSPKERFYLRIGGLPPGEHLVSVRVYDAANNPGLAKVVVR